MPTYEYACAKCGHTFERVQSISESALTVCPKDICPRPRWGKGKVARVISGGAGLIFKGSGFYITDYRSDSYKEAARKESTPAPSSPTKPADGGASGSTKTTPPAPAAKPASGSSAK